MASDIETCITDFIDSLQFAIKQAVEKKSFTRIFLSDSDGNVVRVEVMPGTEQERDEQLKPTGEVH